MHVKSLWNWTTQTGNLNTYAEPSQDYTSESHKYIHTQLQLYQSSRMRSKCIRALWWSSRFAYRRDMYTLYASWSTQARWHASCILDVYIIHTHLLNPHIYKHTPCRRLVLGRSTVHKIASQRFTYFIGLWLNGLDDLLCVCGSRIDETLVFSVANESINAGWVS